MSKDDPELFRFMLGGATTPDRIDGASDVKIKNIEMTNDKVIAILLPSKEGGTTHSPSLNFVTGEYICTCEDYMYKHFMCKHIMALVKHLLEHKRKVFDEFVKHYETKSDEEPMLVTTSIPSGIKSFDELLFGGWPTEVLTVLAGESKIGKTWLMFQSGAYNAAHGGKTLYIETEGVYVRKQALDDMTGYFTRRFGDFRKNFHMTYPRTIEKVCELLGMGVVVGEKDNMKTAHTWFTSGDDAFPLYQLVRREGYNLIVIDSVTKPLKIKIPVPPNQNRGARAAILNPLLGRLERLAEDLKCAVVVIIHLSKDEGANRFVTGLEREGSIWGGQTLKFNVKYEIQVKDGAQSQDLSKKERDQGIVSKRLWRREWVAQLPREVTVNVVPDYGYVDRE